MSTSAEHDQLRPPVSLLGASDPAHPQAQFVGVKLHGLYETTLLTLDACVQQHLAYEVDWLPQVLS